MQADKFHLIIFWIILAGLFSVSIWGGWAERAYERDKDRYWVWYWLRVFKVPLTRENCVRFAKGASIFGLILVTLATIAALLSGR